MARFAIRSAQAGIDIIERSKPHEEEAFFLAMGLVTNTRAIFFALVNRDAERSAAHTSVIKSWQKNEVPELRRFKRILVSVRNQFTKEFSTTPIVVVVTGNTGRPDTSCLFTSPLSLDLKKCSLEKSGSGVRYWQSTTPSRFRCAYI